MKRKEIEMLVVKAAKAVAEQHDVPPASIKTTTCFFGYKGCFNSLAIVQLVVELEERLESDHGVKLILADELAMSRESPFRTAKTLADRIEMLINSKKA